MRFLSLWSFALFPPTETGDPWISLRDLVIHEKKKANVLRSNLIIERVQWRANIAQ